MNKQILRNKYKQIRKNIKDKEKLDSIIFNKIVSLKEYKETDLILTYVSLKEEVDTIELIKHSLNRGKQVAVPKCEGNNIVFYYINSLEDLEERSYGILEPKTNEIVNNFDNSICIVPGIAFDKENNRIGYGRGFYDRFLENYQGIKIGLTYRECICDKMDINDNDVKMDKIIKN
ncbi:MAG: 5-formyltetrahydrofolate cyclo-ligase [Clostridia bacterium]|nr:5-formyltetrahydrofolate cyclo-ligase [Clostridia bacterium]